MIEAQFNKKVMVISSKIKTGCSLKDHKQSSKAYDKRAGQKLQDILSTEKLPVLIYEELL